MFLDLVTWEYKCQCQTSSFGLDTQNTAAIILKSVTIRKPVIFVSLNYQVNTFGFVSVSSFLPFYIFTCQSSQVGMSHLKMSMPGSRIREQLLLS
jgi:hypothetical protein